MEERCGQHVISYAMRSEPLNEFRWVLFSVAAILKVLVYLSSNQPTHLTHFHHVNVIFCHVDLSLLASPGQTQCVLHSRK
jgi:hypothetical protein